MNALERPQVFLATAARRVVRQRTHPHYRCHHHWQNVLGGRRPGYVLSNYVKGPQFPTQVRFTSYEQKAKAVNQEGIDKELHDYDAKIAEAQTKAPWHREGSADPPVRRQRSAGAMTKGKCATTRATVALTNSLIKESCSLHLRAC